MIYMRVCEYCGASIPSENIQCEYCGGFITVFEQMERLTENIETTAINKIRKKRYESIMIGGFFLLFVCIIFVPYFLALFLKDTIKLNDFTMENRILALWLNGIICVVGAIGIICVVGAVVHIFYGWFTTIKYYLVTNKGK